MKNKIGSPEWSTSKKSFYGANSENELTKKYLYETTKTRRHNYCSKENK